jgi:error-prone DNA polymerase
MATLPRMKPKCFYDLVVQVAIIRPGPIQGKMVHPFLARRAEREPVTYYHERLKPVLERTLGVPLFQEQLLEIAMVMADFSGSEAEELRRALSFHRSEERMNRVVVKLRVNMEQKGIAPAVVDQIAQAIKSFALYSFPESHAISFAILAYGSAWMKVYRAPEFYAALLNNQPMGFYSSATLVKDAKRHGVKIRPVCARHSEWFCVIEPDGAVRLGFCMVAGIGRENAERLISQRRQRPFESMDDFRWRVGVGKTELRALAEIGALNCFAKHRRDALWQVEKSALENDLFTFADAQSQNEPSPLLPMDALERLRADYRRMSLTTGPHPMALIRARLDGIQRAADLPGVPHGQVIRIAGAVICRQRPGTAKGFVFISLEDETGVSNAIVTPQLFEKMRLTITQEPFLIIEGPVQNAHNAITIKARRIQALYEPQLAAGISYDFH